MLSLDPWLGGRYSRGALIAGDTEGGQDLFFLGAHFRFIRVRDMVVAQTMHRAVDDQIVQLALERVSVFLRLFPRAVQTDRYRADEQVPLFVDIVRMFRAAYGLTFDTVERGIAQHVRYLVNSARARVQIADFLARNRYILDGGIHVRLNKIGNDRLYAIDVAPVYLWEAGKPFSVRRYLMLGYLIL